MYLVFLYLLGTVFKTKICCTIFSILCQSSLSQRQICWVQYAILIMTAKVVDFVHCTERRFTKFSANYFYNSLFREFNHPSILSFNSKHSRHHFINEILNELNILMLMFDAPCNMMINTILFQYRKSASNTYSYKLK